jgi:hypothetical protein
MDEFTLAMAVALHQDSQGTVCLADAFDLVGYQLGRFVPGYAHVFAFPPVPGVPFTLRVPVDPPERIFDSIRRVGSLLVSKAPGRRRRLVQRLEGLAVLLDLPGVEFLRVVLPVPVERPDPDDFTAFDVDAAGNGAVDAAT